MTLHLTRNLQIRYMSSLIQCSQQQNNIFSIFWQMSLNDSAKSNKASILSCSSSFDLWQPEQPIKSTINNSTTFKQRHYETSLRKQLGIAMIITTLPIVPCSKPCLRTVNDVLEKTVANAVCFLRSAWRHLVKQLQHTFTARKSTESRKC